MSRNNSDEDIYNDPGFAENEFNSDDEGDYTNPDDMTGAPVARPPANRRLPPPPPSAQESVEDDADDYLSPDVKMTQPARRAVLAPPGRPNPGGGGAKLRPLPPEPVYGLEDTPPPRVPPPVPGSVRQPARPPALPPTTPSPHLKPPPPVPGHTPVVPDDDEYTIPKDTPAAPPIRQPPPASGKSFLFSPLRKEIQSSLARNPALEETSWPPPPKPTRPVPQPPPATPPAPDIEQYECVNQSQPKTAAPPPTPDDMDDTYEAFDETLKPATAPPRTNRNPKTPPRLPKLITPKPVEEAGQTYEPVEISPSTRKHVTGRGQESVEEEYSELPDQDEEEYAIADEPASVPPPKGRNAPPVIASIPNIKPKQDAPEPEDQLSGVAAIRAKIEGKVGPPNGTKRPTQPTPIARVTRTPVQSDVPPSKTNDFPPHPPDLLASNLHSIPPKAPGSPIPSRDHSMPMPNPRGPGSPILPHRNAGSPHANASLLTSRNIDSPVLPPRNPGSPLLPPTNPGSTSFARKTPASPQLPPCDTFQQVNEVRDSSGYESGAGVIIERISSASTSSASSTGSRSSETSAVPFAPRSVPAATGPDRAGVPLPPVPPPQHPNDINSQRWYYPSIARAEADNKVKNGLTTGSYLIRNSEKRGQPHTLVALCNGTVKNIPIRKKSDGTYAFGTEKPGETSFATVVEMVEFHQTNPIALDTGHPLKLTNPV